MSRKQRAPWSGFLMNVDQFWEFWKNLIHGSRRILFNISEKNLLVIFRKNPVQNHERILFTILGECYSAISEIPDTILVVYCPGFWKNLVQDSGSILTRNLEDYCFSEINLILTMNLENTNFNNTVKVMSRILEVFLLEFWNQLFQVSRRNFQGIGKMFYMFLKKSCTESSTNFDQIFGSHFQDSKTFLQISGQITPGFSKTLVSCKIMLSRIFGKSYLGFWKNIIEYSGRIFSWILEETRPEFWENAVQNSRRISPRILERFDRIREAYLLWFRKNNVQDCKSIFSRILEEFILEKSCSGF